MTKGTEKFTGYGLRQTSQLEIEQIIAQYVRHGELTTRLAKEIIHLQNQLAHAAQEIRKLRLS